MSIERRYFRLTGSLIVHCRKWEKALHVRQKMVRDLGESLGCEKYEDINGTVVAFVLPVGRKIPDGWRRSMALRSGAIRIVPDKRCKVGKEFASRLRTMDKPDPVDLFDAIKPPNFVCAYDRESRQMRVGNTLVGKVGSQWFMSVPVAHKKKKWRAPDDCVEIEEWQYLKAKSDHSERAKRKRS